MKKQIVLETDLSEIEVKSQLKTKFAEKLNIDKSYIEVIIESQQNVANALRRVLTQIITPHTVICFVSLNHFVFLK